MTEYLRYLPDLLLGIGGTTTLLLGAWREDKAGRDFVRWLTLVFLALAGAAAFYAALFPQGVSWIVWTPLAKAFSLVFISVGIWVVLCEPPPPLRAGEWYALLQFAIIGMLVLARSSNLAALFLGIETLSLALYVLVAFRYATRTAIRGGALYLVLASFASAFLGFGLALIYTAYGTLDVTRIMQIQESPTMLTFLGHVGVGLFLVGAGFKLAAVPFHMWAPDVYEAAPSVVSGIIASASKGATLAALLPLVFLFTSHTTTLYVITVITVIAGNLLGLLEQRPKRILAYSSIAHVGYLLVGYLALVSARGESTQTSHIQEAIFFYVVGYTLAALGAFAVLGQLEDGRTLYLRDLRGLLKRHPLAAWLLMVFVVSLAGIPPTVGFLSKFYLFLEAVKAGHVGLVLWALGGSAIGVFYYTRILAQLFMSATEGVEVKVQRDRLRDVVLTATACLTILWGMTPHFVFALL